MVLLYYTIIDFHLFYNGAVDIQIWSPQTRSQCKVSETQVTVEDCSPSVLKQNTGRIYVGPISIYREVGIYSKTLYVLFFIMCISMFHS